MLRTIKLKLTNYFYLIYTVSIVSLIPRLCLAIVSSISNRIWIYGNVLDHTMGRGTRFHLRYVYFQLRERSGSGSYGNKSYLNYRLLPKVSSNRALHLGFFRILTHLSYFVVFGTGENNLTIRTSCCFTTLYLFPVVTTRWKTEQL